MAGAILEFPKNDAGENEGLGDAGIETFKDDPYASCGREAGQNSRDASDSLPVRMTFDVLDVPANEIPGIRELQAAVTSCLNAATQEKDRDFFEQAHSLLAQPAIKVLRISDFNTKGLTGPSDVEGTPFHSLLKGAGVSNKESETSGGSFGIGKNASFAVSDLQTVFYSTVYRDPSSGNEMFAAQGKTRLVSHVDEEGIKRRATGYWGDPDGFVAVTDRNEIPAWMDRQELGTSIFSAGFREDAMWSNRIAYSLLSNFFYAVHNHHMAFEVNHGNIKINSNTVANLFRDDDIRIAADLAGQLHQLEFSEFLYSCLVSPETKIVEKHIDGLGDVRFRILVGEGLPKRVGIMRNGMLITNSLEHFGSKLERFPGSREFVAIVEPVSGSANKLMKTLENPKHDSFSANRLSDPAKRAAAETAMKRLDAELREAIKEFTAIIEADEVVLEEMGKYFPDQFSGAAPPNPDAEKDPENYVAKPVNRRRRRTTNPVPSGIGTGGGGTTRNTATGGKPGTGPQQGSGSGGSGGATHNPPVELGDLRNTIVNGDGSRRRIWFTPDVSGPARISIYATGINAPEQLPIDDTSTGKLTHNAVRLELEAGVRVCLELSLGDIYKGPIEAIVIPEDAA